MALADAGPVDVDPALAGVQIGTGVGGLTTMENQIGVLLEKGPRRVSPVSRADDDGERRRRGRLDAPRLAGTVRDDRDGVRLGHPFAARRAPPDRRTDDATPCSPAGPRRP